MYHKTTEDVLHLHGVIDGKACFVDKSMKTQDKTPEIPDKQVYPLKSGFWRCNPTIGRFYFSIQATFL
ncbi:hypothetical protein JYB64_17905 [Algoriphagus aestuarii]|nr:hypothetical protein [Algoriphagus aestuarii]